jgi:uncharacterized phage protein gp47/JayE
MAKLTLKSFPQIVGSMAAKVAAETPINDFTDGSVILTLLEAAAQEDFQAYVQMLNIIRNYNLDTTEGEDLDKRASEFGLTRLQAQSHTGFVTIKDLTFTKISTKIYAGLPGPTAGSISIFVDDASDLPAAGTIYIGRGTVNSESTTYSAAPVDNTSYWEITLDSALINDHGTDETVVLAQGGSRVVDAGTEVEIPESDVSEAIKFELNQSIELLDGEDTFENVLVTALQAGGYRVPANSIISFPNIPFTGAAVNNPLPFVNGRDQETDQQLRDRIRNTIQSLSRGTRQSIQNGILGLVDEATNSSIVSANVVPPVNLADGPTKVYIDNGRGLEPSFTGIGLETLMTQATGGEQFFQLQNFPLLKASLVSQNIEPFALSGTETIIVRVGTDEETFTFLASDFETLGKALATEISEAINNRSTLVEARTVTESLGRKVIITPRARTNEEVQIDSASTAQTALNFSELEVATLKLYKNDKLLTKDGVTASVISLAQPYNLAATVYTSTDSDITVTPNSRIVTKAVSGTEPFDELLSPGDYVKFSTDADIFYRKVKTIVSATKLILEEAYPATGGGLGNVIIWNSPQLEVAANGDLYETEIISFGPNDFSNASQALADEVFARVDKELNLSKVELAVNNSRIKFISELENSAESKMQVVGGGAASALGFCSVAALTGTLSFVGNSQVVTGVGTAFLTELSEGQWIKANADGTGSWTKIESIESNTVLYLAEGYRGDDLSGVPASKMNFGEVAQGKNKDYTLNRSNGQIELASALVAGDSLTAGSINTRALVDSIPETYDFTGLGASSDLIVCVDGGFEGTVSTGDGSAPYDNFIDTGLIGYEANLFVGFHIEWISGLNIGQTSTVTTYNTATGQITTTAGFTNPISIGDKFVLCQIVTFTHATDFADPANAQATEVAAALNSQLLGAIAEVTNLLKVRVKTANFSEIGKVQIKGGTANSVLAFPTSEQVNQLNNTAFVITDNDDKGGNPASEGFTLGPNQTLVAIFDGDNLNKTFSVPVEVKGTVTTVTLTTFAALALGAKYLTNGHFVDFWIYWTSGANEGSVQRVTGYTGTSGVFTYSDVFPNTLPNPIAVGDQFSLVPRTAENVVKLLKDLNTTTISVVASPEVVGITGDVVQLSTKTPGSQGKVFVTGGTANSLGIAISGVPGGSPINDVETQSKAGLAKGLFVLLSVDGVITTGDVSAPYDTIVDTSMITAIPNYFTGMTIEILSGGSKGHKTTIASYNNVTGQIVLTSAAPNALNVNDTFRISRTAYVSDIVGTTAPYTINFNDQANALIDVTGFTPGRKGTIRDVNGLNFSSVQVEGVDGYKFYTGLIQQAQWTIDGLDRDATNYPGVGAAGTQFEVLPPVLVRIKLIIDVTTEEGISLSSVSDGIRTAVSEYINSRGVGQDVVLSEIVAAAQSVAGVYDVEISNHTNNIVIADGELARLAQADLIIG